MNGIREQLSKLDPRTRDQWTFEQHKLAQLAGRVQAFEVLLFAYRPVLPNMPEEDPDGKARERFQKEFSEIFRHVQMLENENPPAIIPPMMEQGAEPKPNEDIASRKWQAFGPALFSAFAARAMGMQMDSQVVLGFSDVLDALRDQKPREFNTAVRAYRDMVAKQIQDPEKMAKASFEAWHNHFDPVSMCLMLYVVGGILCMLSAVGLRQPLRRSAFWVLLVVFILHTIAIVCRIYISGRAPVINLYSSAVFIGWAMVLGALIIELLYPIGLGGILGSTVGFSTLLVAYGLDTSDTMPVLQAVLDTQFWLATHVTTVALGYGATFLAGGLGIAFVVVRTLSKLRRESGQQLQESKQIEQLIYRICYGVVCFALFFSFVGTVLGGLWGDDSWGRFWGWDPKENGALMIVLWNAILLHARWDKLIRRARLLATSDRWQHYYGLVLLWYQSTWNRIACLRWGRVERVGQTRTVLSKPTGGYCGRFPHHSTDSGSSRIERQVRTVMVGGLSFKGLQKHLRTWACCLGVMGAYQASALAWTDPNDAANTPSAASMVDWKGPRAESNRLLEVSLRDQFQQLWDGMSDDAKAGYRHLTESVYLPADFDEQVLHKIDDQSFRWPLTDHDLPENSRARTWMRFGLAPRPDDPSKPLQYIPRPDGGYVMNCFACHGGSLYGATYPGAPNTLYALESLTEQVRRTKLSLGKELGHMDIGSMAMPLGTTVGSSNAVMFGVALMNFRDADLNVHAERSPAPLVNHDMDAPPWWHFHRKHHIYIEGFAEKGTAA